MKSTMTKAAQAITCVLFLTLTLFSPPSLLAQEARGTITGKVRDASQSVMPGAVVKITNVAMGTSVTAETSDAGLYQAPYLIPGTYQIVVETKGFKKYVRDGITLRVHDTVEIDIVLEVGEVGESVTVTADSPLLETTCGAWPNCPSRTAIRSN